jgi:transcription elongation factor Elf1
MIEFHPMPDSSGGQRMPGDLRRNRLEIPPCPECEGPDSTVVERGETALTLECPACGCQFEVDKPGEGS